MKARSYVNSVIHWWTQRLSAVVMIPMFLWFIYVFLSLSLKHDQSPIDILLQSEISLMLFLFLLLCAFYHSILGIQVICQDYIRSFWLRNSIILLVKFLSVLTILFIIISIKLIN